MRKFFAVLVIFFLSICCAELLIHNFQTRGTVEFRNIGDWLVAHIDGWELIGKSGEPLLPAFPYIIILEGKYNIRHAEIFVREWQDFGLLHDKKIIPRARPILRLPENFGKKQEFLPDSAIYSKKAFFMRNPGFTCGYDGKNTIVSVLIPAQYNPILGILRIPKNGEILIDAQGINEMKSFLMPLFDQENLIIAPPMLMSAAESLVALHILWGVTSSAVSTDWINSEYGEAPLPDLPGFPETTPSFEMNYDISLAQKIIEFLRDEEEHPYLMSVTILGDADQVPPSFYYYDGGEEDDWDAFVPTDFFYASPEYEWIPRFAVGRIPVRTTSQALTVIDKLRRWQIAANEAKFGKILYVGGKPFGGVFFDDEHTMMHIAGEGVSVNADWHKLYTTRSSFKADSFSAYFSRDWGFICETGHGSGYELAFDDGSYWGVDNILYAPRRDFSPVLFAGVCLNGMFDQEVIPDIGADETFAEALTNRVGGTIALFSATRTSFGVAISSSYRGNVIVEDEEYITEIGFRLAKVLSMRPSSLADWYLSAITMFTTLNDMTDEGNIKTILEFIMHGDPALPLPQFPLAGDAHAPTISMPGHTYMTTYGDISMPAYHSVDASATITSAEISFFTRFNEADAHVLRKSTSSEISIMPDVSGAYVLSSDAVDGSEARIHLLASPGDIIVDGSEEDWEYFGHVPLAEDPDDFEQDWLEMTYLYALADDRFLYIGFPVSTSTESGRVYQLAIDFIPRGYWGEPGYDTDASGIFVSFPMEHAIDIEFCFHFASYHGWTFAYSQIFDFLDGTWSEVYPQDIGATLALDTDNGFAEMALPVDYFGGVDRVHIIAYSAPSSFGPTEYPAQDCVPSDSAAYHSLVTGSESANLLTNFLTVILPTRIHSEEHIPQVISVEISPNPFNSSCRIFAPGCSRLTIFDLQGKIVENILLSNSGEFLWIPDKSTESGVYLVRAVAENGTTTKKAILLK